MDIPERLKNLVGKMAGAPGLGTGIIEAVELPGRPMDDIERAITESRFAVRFDEGRTVVISGFWLDQVDHNRYLIPSDCPWLEAPGPEDLAG
jgi:hypothetical protein